MSVYFISNGAYVKIGVASNPKKRLKALQTGNPHKLELLRVIKGGHAEEAALHAHFAHLRVNGEWFKSHSEMLHIEPRVVARERKERRSCEGSWIEFKPGAVSKKTGERMYYAKRRMWVRRGGQWIKRWLGRVAEIPPLTEVQKDDYVKRKQRAKSARSRK